jgi:erythromycin esterase-like protein
MTQTFKGQFAHDSEISQMIRRQALPFTGAMNELDSLMELIGNSSIVLLGEASHGTHEFYKTRIDLTRRLIEEKGFNVVAVEADWPDAWQVNQYVKGQGVSTSANAALSGFQRFPTWLWRNADVLSFVEWLKKRNQDIRPFDEKVGFYGLDLYSLYRSAEAVVAYLQPLDRAAAERAKLRYSCLSRFGTDEQAYGYASHLGLTRDCEEAVIAELVELKRREATYMERDGRVAADDFFFAEQNAKLIRHAQEYYREMFAGRISTWNLRDNHMMETLGSLRDHLLQHGQQPKVVVWAHNSHLGDARATQMNQRGELNVGQLVREKFPQETKSIGFTCYSGTVTAASGWGSIAERKNVRPALEGSYEQLFHKVDLPSFILPLKSPDLVSLLRSRRLERAIGVIYLPETERLSHYFWAQLPDQFDAIIHFQETQAVEPLERTAKWIRGEDRAEDTID